MRIAFLFLVIGQPDRRAAIARGAPQIAFAGEDEHVAARGRILVIPLIGEGGCAGGDGEQADDGRGDTLHANSL